MHILWKIITRDDQRVKMNWSVPILTKGDKKLVKKIRQHDLIEKKRVVYFQCFVPSLLSSFTRAL